MSDWHDLTAFMVADANYTITPLSFKEENLFTNTTMTAFILTPRVGLRGKVTKDIHAALWGGAMYQDVSEEVAGAATHRAFAFLVTEGPVAPWNALIGGRFEVGKHLDLIVEGGIGTRTSILGGATFRF